MDEQFVKRFCETYGIPMSVKRFDTQEYAKKKGISIEMAARELRYDWFEEMRQKKKMDYTSWDTMPTTLPRLSLLIYVAEPALRGSLVFVPSKIAFCARSCPVPGRRSSLTLSKTNWGIEPIPPTTRSTTCEIKYAT